MADNRWGNIGHGSLRFLTSRWIRFLIIVLALGGVGWLVLTNIWQPLHEFIALPAGLSTQNPQLDEAGLNVVNGQRAARSAYAPRSYLQFDRQFAVSSPVP